MNWPNVPLSKLIEKPISGEWGKELVNGEQGCKVIRSTNFTNEGKLSFENGVAIRSIDPRKIKQKHLKKGDIIIEKSGGSPKQPVGRVIYFDEEDTYLTSNFTSVLRPKKDVFPKYLLYQLLNHHQFGTTLKYQNKTTGIINLKLNRYIKELQIPLPPLPIQKKIAAILDAADAYRQKTKALIEKYDELTQSLFLEMFGDPVRNEKGWEQLELKTLATKIGSGATPRGGKDSYKKSGISLIRSLNIHDHYFKVEDLAFIDETQAEKLKNVVVEKEDVLFNITGASVCRCCLVPEQTLPARVNQHVTIIRPKKGKLNSKYLAYYLTSPNIKRQLLEMASKGGATREAITKEDLQNYKIKIPYIELQNEFEKRLINIEVQKEKANKSLKKSEQLFQSLLQRAFKGELVN